MTTSTTPAVPPTQRQAGPAPVEAQDETILDPSKTVYNPTATQTTVGTAALLGGDQATYRRNVLGGNRTTKEVADANNNNYYVTHNENGDVEGIVDARTNKPISRAEFYRNGGNWELIRYTPAGESRQRAQAEGDERGRGAQAAADDDDKDLTSLHNDDTEINEIDQDETLNGIRGEASRRIAARPKQVETTTATGDQRTGSTQTSDQRTGSTQTSDQRTGSTQTSDQRTAGATTSDSRTGSTSSGQTNTASQTRDAGQTNTDSKSTANQGGGGAQIGTGPNSAVPGAGGNLSGGASRGGSSGQTNTANTSNNQGQTNTSDASRSQTTGATGSTGQTTGATNTSGQTTSATNTSGQTTGATSSQGQTTSANQQQRTSVTAQEYERMLRNGEITDDQYKKLMRREQLQDNRDRTIARMEERRKNGAAAPGSVAIPNTELYRDTPEGNQAQNVAIQTNREIAAEWKKFLADEREKARKEGRPFNLSEVSTRFMKSDFVQEKRAAARERIQKIMEKPANYGGARQPTVQAAGGAAQPTVGGDPASAAPVSPGQGQASAAAVPPGGAAQAGPASAAAVPPSQATMPNPGTATAAPARPATAGVTIPGQPQAAPARAAEPTSATWLANGGLVGRYAEGGSVPGSSRPMKLSDHAKDGSLHAVQALQMLQAPGQKQVHAAMDQEMKLAGADANERRTQEMHEMKMRHAEEMHKAKMSQMSQPGGDSMKPMTGSADEDQPDYRNQGGNNGPSTGYVNGGRVEPMNRMDYRQGGGVNQQRQYPGGGKADTVPAWLSNGEYVVTARDVKNLGDGDPNEGARMLEQFLAAYR